METDPTALQLIALLQEELKKLMKMRFGEVFFMELKFEFSVSCFIFCFFDAV